MKPERWSFVLNKFNGEGESQQLGSICTPEGLWFAAVEGECTFNDTDQALIDAVVKVLNRGLPGGKPRSRKRKKK